MDNTKDVAQYVISRPYRRGKAERAQRSVASLVANLLGVRVLSKVDDSMVLVEMSEEARERVEREHPDFRVEPNKSDYRPRPSHGGG
jgi:hypothetical protein